MKSLKNFSNPCTEQEQEQEQESTKGSNFAVDGVDKLNYSLDKTSLNRGGSYIDSPKWLKNKKATINPKNNDITFLSMQ